MDFERMYLLSIVVEIFEIWKDTSPFRNKKDSIF